MVEGTVIAPSMTSVPESSLADIDHSAYVQQEFGCARLLVIYMAWLCGSYPFVHSYCNASSKPA